MPSPGLPAIGSEVWEAQLELYGRIYTSLSDEQILAGVISRPTATDKFSRRIAAS